MHKTAARSLSILLKKEKKWMDILKNFGGN